LGTGVDDENTECRMTPASVPPGELALEDTKKINSYDGAVSTKQHLSFFGTWMASAAFRNALLLVVDEIDDFANARPWPCAKALASSGAKAAQLCGGGSYQKVRETEPRILAQSALIDYALLRVRSPLA
jgi:hypothetical protein